MTRYVYSFDEPSEGGRNLLGGKGVGLAEMTQLGVPVPAGFTITTDACRAFMASGGKVEGLDEEVATAVGGLVEVVHVASHRAADVVICRQLACQRRLARNSATHASIRSPIHRGVSRT